MSRQVNQVIKTGRSFCNNTNDQMFKINSRGDALEYRRAEQIGLEVKVQKQDDASNAAFSESSGFEGSAEPNGMSESLTIFDNRLDMRINDKPSYIGEMKVSQPFKKRSIYQGQPNYKTDNQSFVGNQGYHDRKGTNYMVIRSKEC